MWLDCRVRGRGGRGRSGSVCARAVGLFVRPKFHNPLALVHRHTDRTMQSLCPHLENAGSKVAFQQPPTRRSERAELCITLHWVSVAPAERSGPSRAGVYAYPVSHPRPINHPRLHTLTPPHQMPLVCALTCVHSLRASQSGWLCAVFVQLCKEGPGQEGGGVGG